MKVCTTDDIDSVDRVLKHPSVFNRITDDGSPDIESFTASSLIENGVPVIMTNDDTVFFFLPHNNSTYDIHITTTPEARGNIAMDSGKDAIGYAFNSINGCEKLICFIPEIYGNVLSFAEANGFVKEGMLSGSYKKNGKLYSENILGLRRSQWELAQR